ncbi:cation diffusion facilitator family transporter [Dermacoccus nishinomiyaensis]|uniref:cation diffusion facilitator family transporter n=1 Tax=Dermacoccus nishinomiyaensis TaxID=1274 RepID=UPI0013F436EC|nr:cation diffusion facilitator family transporter [Dermacoccus nishinomiyaensis]MCG7430819.1 cation diffusion facilitator family transporter [Dermacoccus nishinomiyaensis]NHC33013.1 cation transporter [Dermacoccus nishinomiyaensis]
MGHDHGHASAVTAGGRHRRPLMVAFGLTAAYMVVELVTGLVSGSLALLSDAAHMGTDVLGLGMALAAITLAQREATSQRTYGTYRLEVLAALANGILLFGVAGYVLFEAWQRFAAPPAVPGLPMLVVATVGLIVNLISFRLLAAGSKESLNLKGAYLEVLSDMLGSVGVIVAAIIIFTTGWRYADPLIGAGIGLFILPRTYTLTAQAVRILMEVAPPGLDVDQVRARILTLPGVADVHDLHIWTVTSGMETATGHVVLADDAELHPVLDRVTALLAEEYHVTHATIQCEPGSHQEHANPI